MRTFESQSIANEDERKAIGYIQEALDEKRKRILAERQRSLSRTAPNVSTDSDSSEEELDEFSAVGPKTEYGQNWLRPKAAGTYRDWPPVTTYSVNRSLYSGQWLQTATGRAWLRSTDGYDWLNSEQAWRFLREPNDGHVFLSEPDGWEWLRSWGGQAWLDEDDVTRLYLTSPTSKEWRNSPEGRNWWEPRPEYRHDFPEPSKKAKERQTRTYKEDDDWQYLGNHFTFFNMNLVYKVTFVRFKKQRPVRDDEPPEDYEYHGYPEDKGKKPMYTLASRETRQSA
ncbi:hypothetical protein PG994_008534 [Apiospora phragmitis]|uniref:Uncharacterized protein n=1 Tax=Apiospora phragmitis TaxID=2905665 RepID=A0ABR1UJ32_9PEZI